jgi:proteasome accessory factor C
MAREENSVNLKRTSRLLNLVPYLLTHQGITLDDLSKEFAVSQSQLLEDLNTLWMCGLPGYTPLELMDLSFDSGFVTIWNAETLQQPRSLTRDEVLTLVLGLRYLLDDIGQKDVNLTFSLTGLISRLTESFDTVPASKVRTGAAISAAVRGTINKAVANREVLMISYHSMARDEVTERKIHPLELRIDDEVEYLYAYCELSAGYRTFRLDRILSIASTVSENESRLATDPVSERRFQVEITVSSRLRDAVERFRMPFTGTNVESVHTITVQGFSTDWIVREIMSFGGEVCLQSPKMERDLVRQRSVRTLAGYGIAPSHKKTNF